MSFYLTISHSNKNKKFLVSSIKIISFPQMLKALSLNPSSQFLYCIDFIFPHNEPLPCLQPLNSAQLIQKLRILSLLPKANVKVSVLPFNQINKEQPNVPFKKKNQFTLERRNKIRRQQISLEKNKNDHETIEAKYFNQKKEDSQSDISFLDRPIGRNHSKSEEVNNIQDFISQTTNYFCYQSTVEPFMNSNNFQNKESLDSRIQHIQSVLKNFKEKNNITNIKKLLND